MSRIPKSTSPETRQHGKSELQSRVWNGVVVSLRTKALEIPSEDAGCITFKTKRRHVLWHSVGKDVCAVWFSITVAAVQGSGCASWAEQERTIVKQITLCATGRRNPKQTNRVELELQVKYACSKRPFLSGHRHCLPPNTSVAYTLLESRVCYMQLLTPADNTKCPQFFHYLWNVCWVQSVASWWKSSNNEALSDFWQRHIQTHKNKFKHYHLCIILSWHVSLVTTICSQKTLLLFSALK